MAHGFIDRIKVMTFFKKLVLMVLRTLIGFLAASIAAIITFFAHGRISAALAGIPLHELSEDYGGAFAAVLLSLVVFLVVFIASIWATRKLT